MSDDSFKEILVCFIEHLRPDGTLMPFDFMEVALLTKYAREYREAKKVEGEFDNEGGST